MVGWTVTVVVTVVEAMVGVMTVAVWCDGGGHGNPEIMMGVG